MAKMFKYSEDADVSELAIFSTPPTNTSVRNVRYTEHHPISGLENVIHFTIKGNSLNYLDLSRTRLYLQCKIVDKDGNEPPSLKEVLDENNNNINDKKTDGDVVFPINHLMRTMWKQVEVFVGGKLISSGTSNYHYKSMIKTLLHGCSTDGDVKKMGTELFHKDEPGMFDEIQPQPANGGALARVNIFGPGHTFEMEGLLGEDALDVDKYIINGLDIEVKLYPARSSFVLMSNKPKKEYSIIIEQAVLKACSIDVGNTIVGAHDHSLSKGGMGQYFFTQSTLNNYSISRGERNFRKTIYMGNVPQRIAVALVSSNRYNGSYDLNPFLFHHYNLTGMSLLINDVNIPHRPLTMNFARKQFSSALFNMMSSSNNVLIDKHAFSNGYSLFVFDINPPQPDNDDLSLQETGTVRLEMTFEEELPESVQVLVYGEFQSCFQIDHSRAVIHTPL